MPRIALYIEYDGTSYNGWQAQREGRTIQQALERAIKGFCNQPVTLVAAGRTDAGVHAEGQVCHMDIVGDYGLSTIRDAINFHLKGEAIAVRQAVAVPDNFHARFSATHRAYRYQIINRSAPLVLARDRAMYERRPLDSQAMHAAAQYLLGRHDFTSFRGQGCQARSPVISVDSIQVERVGNDIIHIRCIARSFLYHMVRNIVGSLCMVGLGKWEASDIKRVLEACDRRQAGPMAPACGLYLADVGYEGLLAAEGLFGGSCFY